MLFTAAFVATAIAANTPTHAQSYFERYSESLAWSLPSSYEQTASSVSDGVFSSWMGGLDPRPAVLGFTQRMGYNYTTQFSFPFRYARKHPGRSLLFLGGMGALVALDQSLHDFMDAESGIGDSQFLGRSVDISNTASEYFPHLLLGLGGIGLLSNSPREKDTAWMLTESYLTSVTWATLLSAAVSKRERPHDGAPEGAQPFASAATGPSGHTTAAFAAATVLAHQYPKYHIVPALSFGTASAIGYAQAGTGQDWFSEVVMGAVIGLGSALQVIDAHSPGEEVHKKDPGLGLGVDFGKKGLALKYKF